MAYGPKQTLEEGYNKFVIKNEEGCWDWSGYFNVKARRPQFWCNYQTLAAHRVSWELFKGDIPKGMKVKRQCNNPKCTNPDHLYLDKFEKREGRDPLSLKKGFEKYVIRKEGCWDWKGHFYSLMGYGRFQANKKMKIAHRASWEIYHGEIPEGICVLHKCDNPRCSNPEHLFLGTIQDNNLDMMQKNRNPMLNKQGEQHLNAKLKDKQVIEIKKLLQEKLTQKEIAKMFDVERTTISNIKRNTTWKHVGGLS